MTYLSQQAVVRNYPHEWKKAERKVWFSAHEVEYLAPGHSKSATHEGCVALEYELRYLAAEHRINGGPVRGDEKHGTIALGPISQFVEYERNSPLQDTEPVDLSIIKIKYLDE